jgi:hypothetical protein
MPRKIFVSLCFVMSLCIGIQAMDNDKEKYANHQVQPRISMFKTAIVAFGLMFSPQPVQSVSEFGACYLMGGTIHYGGTNGISMNSFDVSQIRTSGCPTEEVEPFNPLGPIKDISMNIYTTNAGGSTVNDFHITSTYLCSRKFTVSYPVMMDYGFNMSGNNCYYPDRPTQGNFLVTIDKSDENRGKENIVFDNTFAKFMNSGICPPSTTSDPK